MADPIPPDARPALRRRHLGAWLLYAAIAALTLALAERLTRRGLPTALTRRLVHAVAGLSPLIVVPIAEDRWAALLPYALTVGGNAMLLRRGGLPSLDVKRRDGGIVYLPLAQVALLAWGWPRQWAAVRAAVVALALGDSLAALLGERWGHHRYRLAGSERSLEGSAVLALVTGGAALLSGHGGGAALGAGAGATLVEALSPYGTDNLTIPAVVALTLRRR